MRHFGLYSCDECGYSFDVHDLKINKPRMKEHVCENKCWNCGQSEKKIWTDGSISQYICTKCGRFRGLIFKKDSQNFQRGIRN